MLHFIFNFKIIIEFPEILFPFNRYGKIGNYDHNSLISEVEYEALQSFDYYLEKLPKKIEI